MSRKPLLALMVIALTILLVRSAAAEMIWSDCEGCHTERKDVLESPFVDADELSGSVHKDVGCRDCHSDIHEAKHDATRVPHQLYAEKVSCMEKCHVEGNEAGIPSFKPMDQYRDSAHGRALEADLGDAATCVDCHGSHNIRPKEDPKSSVYRGNVPRTCARCHENMQFVVKHNIHVQKPFEEYEKSKHGKALLKDGLVDLAATCTDCHGVHDIQPSGTVNIRPRRPETCGACHVSIYATYEQSTHGKAHIEEGIEDAPTCADCHMEHASAIPVGDSVASICSKCHAEEGVVAKYDIPVDRTTTYEQSYHGIAGSYGSMTVANCASCHGYHDILPPTDPESSVYPANLQKTCGKPECHPGISSKVALAKMHVDVKDTGAGAPYYLRQAFIWAFLGLLALTFIWAVPDIIRRLRRM